jgi:hypothetical protein
MTSETGKRTLPLSPHPDHLRKEAKARLADLKAHQPMARLADAQFIMARDYGFASWGHLMAEVISRGEGPRSHVAAFRRWRLRPIFDPDAEQEAHIAFFRIGAAAHVGFFLAAFAGTGLVVLNQLQTTSLQAAMTNLALFARAIL